ncbi:ABC transporter ATP-binding protein [Rugosimonospora africana]|uniref:Multidrug ABC transporter permease n=1 Tax=Rugosimonospora africana TaxID=556532 RepID=A0A8J3VV27_9ACTN|nr:ABC transporter ATP-binding protein [Rugosimonospora africana]GIH19840.1 multidrug ABC transporter permease [Rugosimonospora africana]
MRRPRDPAGLGWSLSRTLATVWRPAPGLFAGYGVLSALGGLLVPVSAAALAALLSHIAAHAPPAAIAAAALELAVAAGTLPVVTHLSRYVQAELGRRIANHTKTDLMRRVNAIDDLGPLEDPSFLDRLRLAQHAGASAPQALAQAVFGGLRGAVTVAGFVVVLATVAPWLAAVSALACLPAAIAAFAESRRRAEVMWETSPRSRREMFYAGLMTDARAAKEIRLWGIGELLGARMTEEIGAVADAERRIDRGVLRTQTALAAAGAAVTGAAIVWAALRAAHGGLGVGQLSAAVAALTGLQASTGALVRALADGYRGVLAFTHYLELTNPAPARTVTGGRTPALRQRVQLRAVCFAYPGGAPVLTDVSFSIPAGAMVALVGVNGAGKSTLIKLLCRLYEPTSGAIVWDGLDIATLDAAGLRARLAVVFQDFMAYDFTAAENIGLGDVRRMTDRAALRTAATDARVHETLAGLPAGYDTMLSRAFGGARGGADRSGVQLSGGQWQRVALARALLRDDADLLILDEPTAGLDAAAEAEVLGRLHTLRRGRTTLLISHRLSAVRGADRIVVLAGGRVAEQGDHASLMAAGGEYARLFERQAAGYATSSGGSV